MRIKDLKKEVKANIPDLSDKISAMTDWQSIALNSAETNKKINQAAKKPIKKSWSFTFAAIAAVLVMAIVLPVTLNNKTAPVVAKADYEVIIDVNPTIKLTVNGNNDKVKSQGGMNKDGVEFLYGDNYVGQPINDATKKICDKLQSYGFISVDRPVSVLAQTVDKEDISSRADINRAKKSTVMDSYLALSGKTINTLKQEYSEYESENYRIVPDNEAECFDIYNKDGERLGAFSYSDIKIRQDETTGKQFLISEHGTMSYDALVLDDELKDALQNVMDKDSLDVETLQGFTLNTHSDTGIQYLVKDGEEGRGGKVLLQNEADRKRYEELAEMYFDKYPNLIESREEGFIWADLEIRGMAKRTDQGIISIGADGMSYSDNENYKNNWSVRFSGSMYEKLYEWLQNNKDSMEEIHKFSTWQKVFDEIGGTYERVWSKEELDQGYLNN